MCDALPAWAALRVTPLAMQASSACKPQPLPELPLDDEPWELHDWAFDPVTMVRWRSAGGPLAAAELP